MFKPIQNALENRYKAWSSNRDKWVDAMIYLMHNKKHIIDTGVFRWFDSGDIQGSDMLNDINTIAWASPHIRFWLPTKEYKLIKDYDRDVAPNLMIRVSNPNINNSFTKGEYKYHSSAYSKDKIKDIDGHLCPSSKQDNKCGSCRACWSDKVSEVIYIAH